MMEKNPSLNHLERHNALISPNCRRETLLNSGLKVRERKLNEYNAYDNYFEEAVY